MKLGVKLSSSTLAVRLATQWVYQPSPRKKVGRPAQTRRGPFLCGSPDWNMDHPTDVQLCSIFYHYGTGTMVGPRLVLTC